MSEELRALRDMARKFSREEILPVAAEHDRTGEVEILTFVSILCYLTCIFIFACFVLLVSLEDHQESSWPWSTQYTCPRRIWYVTNIPYADVVVWDEPGENCTIMMFPSLHCWHLTTTKILCENLHRKS